jgi:predicted phage tail protein
VDNITVSADKIEALREDVNEFRQDMRAMSQAVQQLLISQNENRFTKEHVERVEVAVTTGIEKITQTIAMQQTQLNEINRTVFLHSKIWTGITIALGLLFAPTLGLLGWNNSQMEALKERQVSQNVRLTLIEQKLELDPRERDRTSVSPRN